jgi:PD-(D/E)XK nuclease superfamily
MYISYSGFSSNEKCPYSYWHRYVAKTVPPVPDNRINMLYGGTIGISFEHFYNQKMWRLPNFQEVMVSKVPELMAKVMSDETAPGKNGIINWTDEKANFRSLNAVIEAVQEAIPRGLKIIRHHRLVGPEATAEMKLDSKTNGHILGGRCDILVQRVPPHNDTVIVDGKGSKFRDQYVDKRQLRWYAMLFEDHRKRLPDKVGFLYWRSDPETGIDWYEVKPDETAELRQVVFEAMEKIEERKRSLPVAPEPTREQILTAFPAQPSFDHCKWCNYLSACDEGTRFMANRGKAPLPISEGDSDGSGVDDVGL